MTIRYTGLIAPEEQPTGDGRLFGAGKGTTRPLPLPVMAKFTNGGHQDAPVVGKLVKTFPGPGGTWGSIDFLDPEMVPEVKKACYMLDQRVMGPSVDLDRDFTVEQAPHPSFPDTKIARFTRYNVVGVTLVPMPAFSQVHLSVDNDNEQTILASVGIDTNFDVNVRAWDSWPLADRDYTWSADAAVKRIAGWSGIGTKTPSLDHYASAFLWRNGNQAGPSLAQDDFRLPLADIINGQPQLVYHAVYAAAALLAGGHGGLPNIPPADQERMKGVINAIYDKMAKAFGDSGMKSPFAGGQVSTQAALDDDCGCDVKDAEPVDQDALLASVAPLAPPKEWFGDPHLARPTRFTIADDGRVFGHVAQWKQCHLGIGDRCVIAPKSRTNYRFFRLGPVVTADGSMVDCGKITLGAGHAHERWGIVPSREHYDNSSLCAAVVNVGEDKFGIWVAGALTTNMTPEKVAELRRSPLSGDWRLVDGNLEMIAALAVNNPGFVIRDEGGEIFSMQGVGVVEEDGEDFSIDVAEVVDVAPIEQDNHFDIRLQAIQERRDQLKAKQKGDRLKAIDTRMSARADAQSQQILAVQKNARFAVVQE